MDSLVSLRLHEPKAFAFYDVSGTVKSWGRRGVLAGGVFGFLLGVALVAIPFTSDVLTFGVIGTLIVAVVEGAVIAGAFAVGIAALYGRGTRYSRDDHAAIAPAPIDSTFSWKQPQSPRGPYATYITSHRSRNHDVL